ncbi:MAG: cyclase family protein [Bacteroidetes bacterium]|nr:cyclase family protein [Bacteroidota bacterium]
MPFGRQKSPNAFYLSQPKYTVVEAGNFVGNVARGGSCNVEDITFNPHGSGTHTECAGHISHEAIHVGDCLKEYFFSALLISVSVPENKIVSRQQIEDAWLVAKANFPKVLNFWKAIIIRTLPNRLDKKTANYSGGSHAFFSSECMDFLNEKGIKHLLTDLPSVDKEDDPNLTAHKVFFSHPTQWNKEKTITEMVFIPDEVADGFYLLNLQLSTFEADAAPSRPVLFEVDF